MGVDNFWTLINLINHKPKDNQNVDSSDCKGLALRWVQGRNYFSRQQQQHGGGRRCLTLLQHGNIPEVGK